MFIIAINQPKKTEPQIIMPDHSIPYYSGELLPEDFTNWLSTIPKGYEWYANDLGKDQSTYTFYKVDADD